MDHKSDQCKESSECCTQMEGNLKSWMQLVEKYLFKRLITRTKKPVSSENEIVNQEYKIDQYLDHFIKQCEIAIKHKRHRASSMLFNSAKKCSDLAIKIKYGNFELVEEFHEAAFEFIQHCDNEISKKKPSQSGTHKIEKKSSKRICNLLTITSGLLKHHKYENNNEDFNHSPITQKELSKLTGLPQHTISKTVEKGFWKKYKNACKPDMLRGFLKKLDDGSYAVEASYEDKARMYIAE